ncbi:AAA family ATPase [Nocardia sp. BMG111209]|uniref:nucleotide-binding protein n=1 Tax=Nocardia sp. BMG111209 TaxID=1160137 RepID=UPI000364A498|nr:AAA family ATPase [Nocardia sp. BMG111209]
MPPGDPSAATPFGDVRAPDAFAAPPGGGRPANETLSAAATFGFAPGSAANVTSPPASNGPRPGSGDPAPTGENPAAQGRPGVPGFDYGAPPPGPSVPARLSPDGAPVGGNRPDAPPFAGGRPGEPGFPPGPSGNGPFPGHPGGPESAEPQNAPWAPEQPATGGRHRITNDSGDQTGDRPPYGIGPAGADPQFEPTTRFTSPPSAEAPPSQFGTAPGQYENDGAAPGYGTAPQAGQPPQAPDGGYGQPNAGPGGRRSDTPQQQWGTPNYAAQQYSAGGGIQPSLDDVPVRRARSKSSNSGWRRAVHHMSGGAINPGMSAEERRLQELVARIRQPVRGDYRIAVLSLKGGVGKTTTTMGIGSIFASIRGDRVIAVDANPDFGTLSQRVVLQTRSTVRDLLLDPSIGSYSDVRRHTSQSTSRLEVLASERDPAASESFSDEEYRQVARILQRFYNIILTDCGTGLMHSAMAGVLDLAHSLVLISSSAIDGARSAAATLDWLSLHGHDHLVRNAVVVINLPRPGSPNVGIQQLREYFLSRCRAVHIIPFDSHLSEGAEIDLARLNKDTKRALVELSATVADDFATDHRRFLQY